MGHRTAHWVNGVPAGKRFASLMVVVLVVVSALALGRANAATKTAQIAGRWSCCGSGGAAASSLDFTETTTGTLGGTVSTPSGSVYATISGTVTGDNLTFTEVYTSDSPGYTATFTGTVAGDLSSMGGRWDSNAGQSGTWTATPVALAGAPPPPVLAKSVDAAPVSGTVLVELGSSHTFVRLTAGKRIPLGSTVDTTKGQVALTASDRKGHTTHGDFYDGIFRLTGEHTAGAELTLLTLTGPKPSGCAAREATTARHRPPRSLWGRATGNFKTIGSDASATERGTKWLTEDTCAGTLITVAQGSVVVDDFSHHRTFVLHAPHSFLAHPGTGG